MKIMTAFFLSAICSLSLAACAKPTPTPAVKPVEIKKEIPSPDITAPVVTPIQPSAKDVNPMIYSNNPSTMPPITAAELRKNILELIVSLHSREDTNQANVEKIMNVKLTEDEGSGGRFSMRGDVQEGWGYWYYVRRLDNQDASRVEFRLYHNEELANDALPKTCTLVFEGLAKEIVAMGYERGQRPIGNEWGFGKDIPANNFGIGIGIKIYRLEDGNECVESIYIGSGVLHE
jgi:hypothetical protein